MRAHEPRTHVFAAALLTPTIPPAPPPGDAVQLQWSAPAGCPDASTVRNGIEGWSTDPTTAPFVAAEATVTETAEGFTLTLRLTTDDREQTRTLSSSTCDALARATALMIAIARDPIGVAATLPASPEPPAPRPPAPTPTPASAPPTSADPTPPPASAAPATDPSSATTRRTSPPIRIALRPEVWFGDALVPGFGVGLGATAAVLGRDRPWRAELGGAYWLTRDVQGSGSPPPRGHLQLAYATAAGCGVPRWSAIELPLCAGPEVGALVGEGFGSGVTGGRARSVWVGAHASAGISWVPRPRWALTARVEGVASLVRPAFHVDGLGLVHRVRAAGARGMLGLEVRLW